MSHHDIDGRECARGPRCSQARRDPDSGELIGAFGPRAFCAADETEIRRALADLPTVYAELREIIGDPATGVDETALRVRRAAPSVPLRVDIDAVLTSIEATVFMWEDRVRASLGAPPAPYAGWDRRAERLAGACRLLGDRLALLLSLPLACMRVPEGMDYRGGADAGLDILHVHERAERLARPHRPTFLIPAHCPSCGAVGLLRRGGEDDAHCRSCRTTIGPAEYQDAVRVRAEQARAEA